MTPFDPSSQLANVRAIISMQHDFEASLTEKLERIREHSSHSDMPQELLCEAQIEFLLMNSQIARSEKEGQADAMEQYADRMRDGSLPVLPPLESSRQYANAPQALPTQLFSKIPTDDAGLALTEWSCTACGESGKISHAPDIQFLGLLLELSKQGGHYCPKQNGKQFTKISLTLTPENHPENYTV